MDLNIGGLFGKVALVAACLSGCAAPIEPAASLPAADIDLAITNVQVIDTESGAITPVAYVTIDGGSILEIGTKGNPPRADQIVDAQGAYLTPGLWDMHVHISGDADDAFNRVFPSLIAHGVLGVRDMGTTRDSLRAMRQRLDASSPAVVPNYIASGPLLDGVKFPFPGYPQLKIDTPQVARAELPSVIEAGADFFKVYDAISPASYREVHAFARERGMQVTGHIPDGLTRADAARAGQASIEHAGILSLKDCLPGVDTFAQRSGGARFGEAGWPGHFEVMREAVEAFDWQACEAGFAVMGEEQTHFTPTLVMEFFDRSRIDEASFALNSAGGRDWCAQNLASIDKTDPQMIEDYLEFYSSLMAMVRSKGVPILAGTDAQNFCLVPGPSLHWELKALVETGSSPLEALQSATIVPARFLKRGDSEGQVKPGYRADLVLLSANPLVDIAATKAISGVIRAGEYYSNADLEAMKFAARQAGMAEPN